jgi:hypothetical protein
MLKIEDMRAPNEDEAESLSRIFSGPVCEFADHNNDDFDPVDDSTFVIFNNFLESRIFNNNDDEYANLMDRMLDRQYADMPEKPYG